MPHSPNTPISLNAACNAAATRSRRNMLLYGLGSLVAIALAASATRTLAANASAPVASGAVLSAADEKAVRAVVQAQLEAFAADDAKKAFAVAAPNIQALFRTPANFIKMVQIHYPVVYRPASVAYFKPELDGEAVVMKVQMTDAKDTPWLAVYALQRPKGKNATWRIAGCIVTTNVGRTA